MLHQVNYLGHWLIAHDVLIHQRQLREVESLRPKNGHGARQGTRVVFLSSLAHVAGLLKFGECGPRLQAVCTAPSSNIRASYT